MKKIVITIFLFLILSSHVLAKETVKFDSCVDGDTFNVTINGEKNKVRLLAVDTPESVSPKVGVEYYGKEASEYTCEMVKNAKKIQIEYDDKSDKTDKYDRLLAWVFVDGNLLQELLIENGYAEVAYLYDDYKYTEKLKEKQEIAQSKNVGIWNEEAKEEYGNNESQENNNEKKEYETIEIIIIGILLLIIIFVGDKTIKNKAKKKLKKYLD